MNLNEIPAWSDIESQPWFAELTPEEKQQSLTKWQGDMMQFAKDPKEKFAVAATSKAKARSFFGEEMPDDPIADALQRRQKDLEDIGSRYDAFSKGELEEDDEEVLTLNDTLKGNTPYSVIKGRLFVSPQLVWDKAAYEKVVNEAPVDEDERVLAMSAYDGSKERAAEGVVNSLGYTDEAFRDFAAKGFKEGKSNAAVLDEWKANNKLPDGILGTLRGVGRQAYFGLRSGLSGLERAMGGLGGFFGSESAQKYAEESGKEAQSYMQRTLGEGPEFIGELTSGAVSIIPTIAAGAAASVISEGAALPAAASITAGAIQSAGATQAETYEFYRNQGLDHANALAESRVDGLVSGLITGAITHYAGKLGDKIGLGKGIEGLFSGPASKIASKLTQREISESLKAGAKAVGGSFLQEGSEELLDQAAQDAYSMIKRDPTLTLAEAINNALQAGKVGAVLGGAAEAGKIGLNSLLNSAKFAVPTTEEEEALRAKFEVPAAAEEEVIASPEVQQEEQNIKTAADVVKEAAPVAPQTAAVLAGIAEEKAGELAADVVVKTGDALASVEEEAPLVVDETPLVSPEATISPAVETAPISGTITPTEAGPPVEDVVTPAVTTAPLAPIPTKETPVASFQTSKGSTYDLLPDGTTVRNKAARPEHPGEEGIQPRSSKTIFVTEEGADALGIVQAEGVPFEIRQRKDGTWGAVALEGPFKGKFYKTSLISASEAPAVGLIPVELWDRPGKKQAVHFGNKITSVSSQPPQGKPVEAPTNAAPEIPLEESLRQEPQDRVEVRTPEETGVGDSIQRAAEGEKEVAPQRILTTQEEFLVSKGVTDTDKLPQRRRQALEKEYQKWLKERGGAFRITLPVQRGGGNLILSDWKQAYPLLPEDLKTDLLRVVVNNRGRTATEQDVTDVMAFAEELVSQRPADERVFNESNLFYDISRNRNATPEIKARAQRRYEEAQGLPSPPTTGAVPTETLPDGQKVTPRGVASPGVARDTSKPEPLSTEEVAALRIAKLKGAEHRGDGVIFVPEKLMTPERRKATQRGGKAVEVRAWADVTGVPSDRGYAILDRRARRAFRENKPVSSEAVDAYGIKLPEGYVKQGELYVYEKTQPLPKGDAAGERGAVAPAPAVEPAPKAQPEQPSVKVPTEGEKFFYQIRAAQGRPATDADGVPTGWKLNEFRDAIELVSEDASKYIVFPLENPSSYGDKLRALATAQNWAIDNPVRAQLEAAPMEANYGAGRVEDVTPKTVKFVHTTKTTPGKGQKSGYYPGTYAYESESGLLPSMEGNKFVGELPESGIYTLKDADQLKKDAADAGFGKHSGNGNAEVKYLQSLGFKAMRRPAMGGTEVIVFDAKDANFQPAPEAQPEQPVSQPVQAFRDAVSQMSPTAQAKWTPELRATAEAYLESGGTTGLQGLSPTQEKIIKRILDEATRTPEQEAAIRKADAEKLRQAKAKEKAERARESAYRESSLPPTPGKQIRKLGKGAMESVPVVLDEIAKVIPNIRELVEVRESVEGEPDAEGFYDPQADKAVVLVDNVYLKPQHGGSQEAALRETIIHELLHRGFAKLRQTNPQLFEQFEAYSLADTNDAQFEALVRRGYSMYSNWKDDPAQNQKAREEIFIRKAVVDLNFKGIEAIKSPSSLASQFFSWLRGLLNKLLGRKVDDETLLHWSRVFLNAAQADFIEKTPGERMHAFAGEKAIENLPEERRQFMRDSLANKDAEYLDAVEAGDIEKAQRMVDEAAKAAGYDTEVWHGTDEDFTVFGEQRTAYGFFFAPDKRTAEYYGPARKYNLRINKLADLTDPAVFDEVAGEAIWSDTKERKKEDVDAWIESAVKDTPNGRAFAANALSLSESEMAEFESFEDIISELQKEWEEVVETVEADYPKALESLDKAAPQFNQEVENARQAHDNLEQSWYMEYQDDFIRAAQTLDYDGVFMYDPAGSTGGSPESYVVFSPNQIKSADPVTYDDAGNVITLSQRFQTVSPDIRYSLGEPPDIQAEADALREVTPNSQALDKFRETFGTPRQDVGQVLGKKEGSVYTQAQVAPLIEYARSMIGFENDANGDPIISPEATQKALNMVAKINGTPGFASQFNVRAAEVFKGKPVDPEIATAVLTQELQVYANRLSASSPKAEDQILKAALTPFYNTQILGSYLSRRIAGRTLQAASMASGETGDARKSREEAEKAVNKEITKQLGDEALPAAEGMDKAGVEGGVDAIKDDIPAPADPTLRLLDLAVESLDEVAKADANAVFDVLLRLGEAEEALERAKKVGNKAMSILTERRTVQELPSTVEELEVLVGNLRVEAAEKLAKLRSSLEGAKPETKKKVKEKAAKAKSKTDSIQKLIDKLSKMPDESKEAKPKAETLRAAIADAIKEKKFDKQKVRDAATKFGATPEQTERLVEEAERIHEIRQSPKLSKAKLRQFLLSFPKNVLANPEQREALLRSFLKGKEYSEAEINRIVPQVLRDFDTGYQKARKAYLDELEKKLKPKQGQKESKQDQQNRKMLNALRSGLADTTSETSVALAKSLGFEAFRPQDDHILSKLDEEMRKLREQDRISDANAKFVQIRDLLNRRRPPRDFMQVAAQGWITSALSSLSNFAVNVWAPLGEAGVRFTSDILRAAATGRIDEIPLYLEAAIQALKSMPPRAKFAFKTDTFTNSVNTLIADMASMKDELQRALNTYRSKDSSKLAKAAAAGRILFTIGDLSRRVLSTVDDTWYTALSSYIGSSNLIKDLRDAKLPKAAVQAIAFHANNDALHQAQAEHATLDAVSQFVESLRGKTEEEIDAGLEYLGLNDASVTQAQADYIQEIVSALQSLRIRSGATGDDLVKRALKEISNFKAAVNVRAVELGQARTKELLATALTEVGQTPQQIEEAQRNYDENAKKAASFGMGLHRVEGVPSYDIMGKAVQIVDAMGRGAVTTSPLLGRMMVGFFGIPLNLLNKSLWFTPYGLGRYFLAKWQMAKNPEEKFYEYSMSSQREMSQRVNEIIIGHTIMAAAFALGAIRDQEDEEGEGLYITLGGPSNKTEYDAWYARGFRKFSFCYKTKDGSVAAVPYGRGMGEVLKMPLMLLGAFDDMRLNKKLGDREDMSSIIEYLNSAAAGIGNQATFLGAKNTVGAFAPDKIGANTASSIAYAVSNLVPFNGLDRSIAALAVGPPDRSRTGAILANIPIARWLATDPAINVFGDKWGNKSDANFAVLWDRQWNQGLIPLNISAPLTGQDKRLYGFIGERLIGPSPALRGALELRNGYVTDKQWYDYSIYRGQALKREMVTQLDRLRRMDDDSLSKAIAELSTKATKKAKDRFNYK